VSRTQAKAPAARYRYALETVAQWDGWAAQRLRELDYELGPIPDKDSPALVVCEDCGREITYHAECPDGDGRLSVRS
jgi:hypothetical protein